MVLPDNKNRILPIIILLFVVQCILFFIIEIQIHSLNKKIYNNNKLIAEKLINNPISDIKTEIDTNDIIVGYENAPITLAMYSNYNCTICNSFYKETFPELEKQYIKTGKVKFVLKLIVPKSPALANYISKAAIFAYKNSKFDDFHNYIIHSDFLPDSNKVSDYLISELKLDKKALDKFTSNPQIEKYLNENHNFFRKYRLRGTPAFLLNDSLFYGNKSIGKFNDMINNELNK
jgi:protein-disulfide isomerase